MQYEIGPFLFNRPTWFKDEAGQVNLLRLPYEGRSSARAQRGLELGVTDTDAADRRFP